jgi:acyl transferase domain-containing protein
MEDHTPMDPWPPDREPVAVIGFSFRFGGDAISPDRFWDMIINARCAVSPTPKDRFNAEAFYHPDTNRLDCLPVKHGNFLTEDITSFDAPFFNIKAAEAAAMDPQSRKLLEATYRALENAGIPIEKCAGSNTCIFTGVSADDYRLMYVKDVAYPIRHAATGMASSMLANKISWFYDFKGPSVQLDTACSASLNAAHLAVRSIQSGESEMGIVAGANLYFTPESMAPLAHLNFFSPDSRCYSFDHRANGYSRGDGYGVLVLKSLSKAIADKDPIRAVVRSTASNENGRTIGGITKVNYEAQRALISTAYNSAHLDPALTRYVEAHAPGTQGDVVEAAALAAVLSEYRSKDEPLYMGSVKANVGHLEGTSGIASLIKVVMMLERGIIPRLANFERVHPEILGHEWNMAFPTENIPWPPGKRQASVNSFGFGGANAHAVLQDADAYNVRRQSRHGGEKTTPYVVVISAADECAIERVMSKLRHYSKSKGSLDLMTLQDLVFTLNTRRSKFAWKSTVIITQRADFAQFSNPIRSIRPSPLAFVFTGQGAAWCKMGTQFLYNQVYQDSLQQFSDEMKELGACWNIVDELTKDDIDSNINDAAYSQPICTAVQIALCNMLRSFGICPDYVVGHSSGEIAAAYAAGALSARSACKVAFYRGLLVSQTFREDGKYGMLVVGLSEVQVCEYIQTPAQSIQSI